jgi:hypothetical protein
MSAPAKTVRLERGEQIVAVFQRLETRIGRDEEPYVVAILLLGDEERALSLGPSALRTGFRQLRPTPGETVVIEKGAELRKVERGSALYWPYTVYAPDREIEQLDWDSELLGGPS